MTTEELAARVVEAAGAAGVRIAVAESLTGGMLASALVGVPGASAVFSGGIVAYDTALKHSLLGVDAERLRETGPVDAEVARQMARGVRRACAVPRGPGGERVPAEVGVSTTGVAGPDPDPQTGRPAGTVWLGVSGGGGADASEAADGAQARLLDPVRGDRAEVRARAVDGALALLLEHLEARIPQT